eukprot:161362-Amphidinium_carterae.2
MSSSSLTWAARQQAAGAPPSSAWAVKAAEDQQRMERDHQHYITPKWINDSACFHLLTSVKDLVKMSAA